MLKIKQCFSHNSVLLKTFFLSDLCRCMYVAFSVTFSVMFNFCLFSQFGLCDYFSGQADDNYFSQICVHTMAWVT